MVRVQRVVALLLALLIGASGILPIAAARAAERQAAAPIVLAQVETEPKKKRGIFRFLFRNREERQRERTVPPRELRLVPRREREAAPEERQQPRRQSRPRKQGQGADRGQGAEKSQGAAKQGQGTDKPRKARKQRKNRPAAPVVQKAEPVEKAPDAKRVLVLGDFFGAALAKGLTEAFEQKANIVVVDGSKGDSGLVRTDHYNWAAEMPALTEAHKPDAILMLIGANDRQAITTEAGGQPIGTEGWRIAYGVRVAALADALKATARPVFWAGLAPAKSSAMSRDYSAINGVVREQLDIRGMRYVDVWNGFADETGKFVSSGPDVNGQPAQLRDNDGVNFTKSGQRKLAFFVERELNELLGAAQPVLAAVGPADPANVEPAGQPPRIGPMIPLDALPVAGDALSTGTAPADPQRGAVAASVTSRLLGDPATAPPAGRADNFSWPEQPPLAVPTLPAAPPAVAPPPVSAGQDPTPPAPPGPSAAALEPIPLGSAAPQPATP